MGRDADIVVVGGGITLAHRVWRVPARAARARSRPGLEPLERLGLLRLSYPDAHYVRLAQGALEAWRELEDESGATLIVRSGGLDFAPRSRMQRVFGALRYELLTGSEVARRWPLATEPGTAVVPA